MTSGNNKLKSRAKELRSQGEPFPTGSETVLLVADEQGLRTAVREFLRSTGYLVLDASNGMEALTICEGYQGRIDLLLTDYIMPGLSGPGLGTLAIKRQPNPPYYLYVWLYRPHNSGTGLL